MRPNPRRKFNLSLLLISFFAFITLALPVVCSSGRLLPWFAQAAAKPETVPSQRRQRERGQPCPTCASPSPRRIYAPAIELPETERCEIVLNSRSPNPIDVTPTFYTANGETVVGTPVQLQPAEIRFVPIDQLMPETLRGQRKWGGIALSYAGGVLEVWAQITFHGVGGGSIDETFNILEEPGSDTREAVWWMPKRSTSVIALGNSSDTTIHTTAQFSRGESEEIDIPPFATKFLRRQKQDRGTESVKLTNVGPDGSLRVAGFVTADEQNFTSSIRFYDTGRTVQSNLYATNLRLANANSRMVLKNTSDAVLSVRPRFFSAAGKQGNPVELPPLTLQAQQIVDVDLKDLRQAASTRTDLASISAQVLNSGTPGSLIGALYSTDRTSQLTFDVPLRDSGRMRNSTGSYPWRVDNDYTTIVNITNINDQPASFIVDIRYPGGHYFLPAQEVAIGGTATFDLRHLINEQKPDSKGNVIPLSTAGGQFHWSVFGGAASSKFIGRSEVISHSQRVNSSYSCPGCCPDSGPFGYLEGPGFVPVGGFAQVETEGWMMDCNGVVTDTALYVYPWWTLNPSIASVNSTGGVQGLSGGSTFVDGSWTCYIWYPGPEDCDRDTVEDSDSEPMNVIGVTWTTPAGVGAGGGVPLATGTPPQGSLTYVKTTTITATGSPSGGAYSWSTTSNKVTLTNTTSATVTVTAVSESQTTGDVTIDLVYTLDNQSDTKHIPFTVQKPTFLDFISSGPGTASACPSGQSGNRKNIIWQVADKNHNPISFRLPLYDTLTNVTPNSCFNPSQGEGTAPGGGTGTGGRWEHKYRECSSACNNGGSCSVTGSQKYFIQGSEISLGYTMTCTSITVGGH